MTEYLELRYAQMDVLCAELDLLIARIRLAGCLPPGRLRRRIHVLQSNCRQMKKMFVAAEHCDAGNWPRIQESVEPAWRRLKEDIDRLAGLSRTNPSFGAAGPMHFRRPAPTIAVFNPMTPGPCAAGITVPKGKTYVAEH